MIYTIYVWYVNVIIIIYMIYIPYSHIYIYHLYDRYLCYTHDMYVLNTSVRRFWQNVFLTKRLSQSTWKNVTQIGPDKTSKPVLTKCLRRSWQNVFLTKCLRRSWQNVFLAKRPTWQNEFWDFTFRKHEPHFLNRNIPKQDRANTKQCISIYRTLDRGEMIFVKERRARGQSGQEPGCWNSN